MINKTRSSLFTVVAFMLLAVCGSRSAHAQPVIPVSYVHAFGGWYLVEIKDTSGTVMGFWGIPRVPVEVGNIRRLWFESNPDAEWGVWAFEPIAIYEKMDQLVLAGACTDSIDALTYQELMAADTAVDLDIDGGVTGAVIKGFIEGDPLTEAAGTLDDPDTMIDLLATIGYPIAPELSDLLVNGTAGASVAMNPATKQSLDCLRSADQDCSDCTCTRAGGTIETTDWEVSSEWVDFGTRLKCTYTRTETHTYWRTGLDPDDCQDCTAGSPDDPLINIVDRIIVTYWYDRADCPPMP